MASFETGSLERREVTKLINGLVAPRPIAWVSTLSPEGERNLAPFSYFNAFSTSPPTLALGPGSRAGVAKDSLRNIRATRELVVHGVSRELARHANAASGEFEPHVDEWEVTGLTAVPSEDVEPPRIAEAPSAFECRVFQIVDLGEPDGQTNSIVIARVSRIHIDDELLDEGAPDAAAVDLVGRMGGDLWCTTRDRFALPRPGNATPCRSASGSRVTPSPQGPTGDA